MAVLFLGIYFLVWAVCNFTDARAFRMEREKVLDDSARKRYRRKAGIGLLAAAILYFILFIAERIYGITLSGLWAILSYAIPFVPVIMYQVWLNKKTFPKT